MARVTKSSLVTLGDFFHFAVARFRAARLAYGHGTTNAVDEAAFMVLEALRLPISRIDPWLDLVPTEPEKARLMTLIEARIGLRMPAPYLLEAAYMHGVRFHIDRRALIPRSFIGDLLAGGALPTARPRRILDLCCGSGCLAILAALAFPRAKIDAVDLSAGALALARRNVATHRLGDRITLHRGDLFKPLQGQRYDLIISNPPYVDAGGMEKLPPEFRHEPRMALAAGDDGLDLVHRILAQAPEHLTKSGGLVCEIGRGRPPLEAAYPRLPFIWLDTELSEGEVFWLSRSDLA
ncbi:50S ribosomal protein L3 N(5)-glutamine methyltransferase [Reyranella sp.]|jgi:ribosomal protein L3 glutamine methyltransferase|uniref:50S ribosomal protein L3 N(5)-glutamine methyltransferase n=1 Tax=Reyranella sp. TaxID=1929291 RepID=UPI000BD10ED6|nr:50S ribosomal protein L3 N(5)-glutamine methyltransferase [Reyranella sp.]OYY44776.1 MAG: ribosomal protein L3 N(5)-glutamine methyltransferase [Rhodospirillales bacterium 35-66-84]OYZ95386.1 MAG: ribosomal protein L3 N(5)-glutamine methyltransferase [Rhodospirillales bacterium 24-66-33]OZB26839.1 MAG: ribosomal protein L3 N(5)-glutamine methyltransferase [Rhodospirillales bacterium 39-66-50]HQS16137.1 50S ribosomal protein L3 N(5)-glutamine methyltransferase [Reyranella sp.]HQT11617.1 50S 